MKTLLVVTAVIEVGTGAALLAWPSGIASILLGSSLGTATVMTVGRVAGAALLSLGVACWLARRDPRSIAATGLVAAMLLYNATVAALLAYAGTSLGLFGVALWPAVVLHAGLAVWCIACLRRHRESASEEK